MKKLLPLIYLNIIAVLLGLSVHLNAQTQINKINYQGIARNTDGTPMASKTFSLEITILNNSAVGNTVFKESHLVTTNEFGLYNLAIGNGTSISGYNSSLADIDWGSGDKFIKILMDPNGGTSYRDMGTSQLLSVPFSFYSSKSKVADSAQKVSSNSVININQLTGNSAMKDQILKWDGNNWVPGNDISLDTSNTNEIQTLQMTSGGVISLSKNGGTITIMDTSSTNELQTLSISNDTLSLSIGGGSIALPSTWTKNGANQYSNMSGNVGIGVSSPTKKLEVSGTTKSDSLIVTNFKMTNGAKNNFVLKSDSTGNAKWVDLITLDPDNSVTNEIQTISRVNGTVRLSLNNSSINLPDSSSSNEIQILSKLGDTISLNNGGGSVVIPSSWIKSGNNQYASTTGNVGIGLNNPSKKLHVLGGFQTDSAKIEYLKMPFGAANNYILKSDASGNASWGDISSLIIDNSVTNEIQTVSKNNDTIFLSKGGGSVVINPNYWTKAGSTLYVGLPSSNIGNIGIGLPNPSKKLEVLGGFKSDSAELGFVKMPTGAVNNYVLKTDAMGNASWANVNTISADNSPTNEIQVLTKVNDTIMLSNGGGSVVINPTPAIYWTKTGNNQYSTLTGNVGIGTSTPARKLQVLGGFMVDSARIEYFQMPTGAVNNYVLKTNTSGNASWVDVNSLVTDNSVTNELQTISKVNDTITLSNGGGSIVLNNTINTWTKAGLNQYSSLSGNVGIGLSNPSRKLDVLGGFRTDSAELGFLKMPAGAVNNFVLKTNTSGIASWVDVNSLVTDNSVTNELQTISKVNDTITLSNGGGSIVLNNTINTWTKSGLNQYSSLSGNVGIGLSNPTKKLQVLGGILSDSVETSNLKFPIGASNNYVLKSDASGNASWVNVTSLTIDNSTTNELQTLSKNNDTISLSNGGGTVVMNPNFWTKSGNTLYTALTGAGIGNVGIGLPNPSKKLEVLGGFKSDSTETGFLKMPTGAINNYVLKSDASGIASWVNVNTLTTDNSTTNELQTISKNNDTITLSNGGGSVIVSSNTWTKNGNNQFSNLSGNVGIGTTSPTKKLEVAGTTKTDSLHATNLKLTNGAVNNYILRTDSNGNASWQNPTLGQAIRYVGNSYLGQSSGSGSNGTLEGSSSSNVSNVFIGNKVGNSNVSGNNSIGLGDSALFSNTTGGSNIAIGNLTLSSNVSGTDNTAVGIGALRSNVVGVQNTAIGKGAGTNNKIGLENTNIGVNSGYGNRSGSNNVSVGSAALYSDTSGRDNVSIGQGSLRDNLKGSQNTAIGTEAGRQNQGSGNVFIGYQAGYFSGTDSNKLMIANNNTTAPLIEGDFKQGTLKVNGILEVTGAVGMKIKNNQVAGVNNVDRSATVWRYTSSIGAGSTGIGVPVASSLPNTTFIIINLSGSAQPMYTYYDFLGNAQTSIANNTSIWIISDGTNWISIK